MAFWLRGKLWVKEMKTKGSRIFTSQTLHEKERRSLAILELIRKKGGISRTDISKSVGINVVSISNYINSFIEKNLVMEKGFAPSSGGRKPELVELNSKDNYCVGIDICADDISAIVVDIGMGVKARKSVPRPENKKDIPAALVALVKDVVSDSGAPISGVRSIGIGVCCEKLLPVREEVQKAFGIETLVGGAASCGAYAEKRFNPDAASEKLLYMYSDLGRGVFIDGDICMGCVGNPGEFYGEPAAAEGPQSAGLFERARYLNPWSEYLGIVETAKREVERGVGTKMVSLSGGDIENITGDVVLEAARQNDETALSIVQGVAINLGLRTAYLVNLFGPDVVVVSGGPEKARDIMFPPITKMVDRLSVKKYNRTVKIMPSGLGKEGLCLGAAALAVRELFLKA
jgi:predicted NBD/HSP70 family sugar kinase